MTEGEKMVWAATYALHFKAGYDREEAHGKANAPHSTTAAIEWAWAAVVEIRESRDAVLENFGQGDLLEMLDEVLGHET